MSFEIPSFLDMQPYDLYQWNRCQHFYPMPPWYMTLKKISDLCYQILGDHISTRHHYAGSTYSRLGLWYKNRIENWKMQIEELKKQLPQWVLEQVSF